MSKKNPNVVGLTLGLFFALVALVWAVLVSAGLAQPILDFFFREIFITQVFSVQKFTWGYAILLVVLKFVFGYAIGWILAWIWNKQITEEPAIK